MRTEQAILAVQRVQVTAVTQKIPSYLRLHVEGSPLAGDRFCGEEVPGLARLRAAFQRATGWTLKSLPSAAEAPCPAVSGRSDSSESAPGTLVLEGPSADLLDPCRTESVDSALVQELAAAISQILRHLQTTQVALWQREAELAAGVPVTMHPDEELHLAARLEAVLKAGANAVDCQAAAAFLLDEQTKQLKLRACWGLPKTRFLEPPRPLRGAAADLEALVGHAVVVEDALLVPHWRVPEEFRSAVCVPISSPTTPLGTLWLFCNRPRTFGVDQTELLEIVAGRLAAELEREMLLQQTLQSRSLKRQLGYATQWQDNRLPRIKPLLRGWQVAGWTSQSDHLGGDFHDWCVLPDGSLALAVGDAQGKMIEAGLTAASVQTAVKSHANYRHTARELMGRVNETLWSASAGDQFASLFYGLIQPETGQLEYASAGHIYAAIVGAELRLLATNEDFALGTQPDADYPSRTEQLESDDVMVIVSEGVKRLLPPGKSRLLWRYIHRFRQLSADDLIGRIQGYLAQQGRSDRQEDRTILVVKRHRE